MQNIKSLLITLLCSSLAGGAIGYTIGKYLPDSNFILFFIVVFIAVMIFYCLGIVVHEAGHLVMGLLTGYQFLSYRIGNLIVLKQDNQLRFKKYSVAGTAGQCILEPPAYNDNFPFFWYNFGGGFFNLLFALLCFGLTFFVSNNYLSISLLIGVYLNGFLALTNLIPLKLSVPNDGYNIYLMCKEPKCRVGLYSQMKIAALLNRHTKFQDMDKSLFEVPDHVDLNNPLYQSILLNKLNILHEQHHFDEGLAFINYIKSKCQLLQLFENELDCEELFYLIYQEPTNPIIKEKYQHISKYLKATSSSAIERQRLLYAYELLVNHDSTKANLHLDKFETIARNYPYPTIVDTERTVIELIKNKPRQNT